MSLRSVSTIGVLISAAFVAAGVLAGCVVTKEETNTNNGGNTGPVYPFPTESDFCLAKAKAECNSKVQSTCNTTIDACVKARSASAVCNPAELPYQPALAQACVNSVTSAWSDGALTYTEVVANTKACTQVFTQKHIAGDSCSPPVASGSTDLPSAAVVGWQIGADASCDTGFGLSCQIAAGDSAGKCVKANVLPAGGDCSIDGTVCDENLYCNSGTCALAKTLDQGCSEVKLCEARFVCTSGSCVERKPKGQPCKVDTDCAGKDGPWGYCIPDSSGNNAQCFDTFELNAFGSSCQSFK